MQKVEAWGIVENGKLWSCAFSERRDALKEVADAACNECNEGDKKSTSEWIVRVVRVEIVCTQTP